MYPKVTLKENYVINRKRNTCNHPCGWLHRIKRKRNTCNHPDGWLHGKNKIYRHKKMRMTGIEPARRGH